MVQPQPKCPRVFISYSHRDERWLKRLHTHLKPLERDHQLEIWDDTRIAPGGDWRSEIRDALTIAKVAVLLISPDFLASDFIATEELPRLLEAAARNGTLILPVILSSSRFAKTGLYRFQAVNDPAKPLATLSRAKQDAILVKLADAIENRLRRVSSSGSSSEPSGKDLTPGFDEGRVQHFSTKIRFSQLKILAALVTVAAALIASYWQFVYKSDQFPILQDAAETISTPLQKPVEGSKAGSATKDVPLPHRPHTQSLSVDQYIDRADRLLGRGDYPKATAVCDEGLLKYPGNEKLEAEKRRIEIMQDR